MKILSVRLFLLSIIVVFLYRIQSSFQWITAVLFGIGCGLSVMGLYGTERERRLSLLMDRIFITTLLVVFADRSIINSATAAWIIGGILVLSGFDLLERSLESDHVVHSYAWLSHSIQMIFSFALIIVYGYKEFYRTANTYTILNIICMSWVSLTLFFVLQCCFSKRIRRIFKES